MEFNFKNLNPFRNRQNRRELGLRYSNLGGLGVFGDKDIDINNSVYVSKGLKTIINKLSCIEIMATNDSGEQIENTKTIELLNEPYFNRTLGDLIASYVYDIYVYKVAVFYVINHDTGFQTLQRLEPSQVRVKYNGGILDSAVFGSSQQPLEIDNLIIITARDYERSWVETSTTYQALAVKDKKLTQLAQIESDIREEKSAHLKNSVNIGAIISLDKEEPQQEELDSLNKTIMERFMGTVKTGLPFVGSNVSIKKLDTKTDKAYGQDIEAIKREVLDHFGIPPIIFGSLTGSQTSIYVSDQAIITFYENEIIPLISQFTTEMTYKLVPLVEDNPENIYIDFLDPTPINREDITNLQSRGILSVNEVREAFGFEEIDGGEIVNRFTNGAGEIQTASTQRSIIDGIRKERTKARVQQMKSTLNKQKRFIEENTAKIKKDMTVELKTKESRKKNKKKKNKK